MPAVRTALHGDARQSLAGLARASLHALLDREERDQLSPCRPQLVGVGCEALLDGRDQRACSIAVDVGEIKLALPHTTVLPWQAHRSRHRLPGVYYTPCGG